MAYYMSNYLSAVEADYTTETLDIAPHREMWEEVTKEQIVHKFSDGQRGVVTLSGQSRFMVTLQWDFLTPTEAGTIIDLWNKETKGNGLARSWYWYHVKDGQTYTVKFAKPLAQGWKVEKPNHSEVRQITLDILGTKPV